jgi:hypothetical protein
MVKALFLAAAFAVAAPVCAQDVVKGDASAGLVSKTAKAEVHLIADPALNDKRLVLKVIVLNISGSPQPFGPDAVTIMAGDAPVAVASRDALVADLAGGGGGGGSEETAQAHTAAAMPVTATGQTDVSGFTGGSAGGMGGIPNSALDRSQRRGNAQAAAQLDAVLLKPMTIRANGADGGQLLTERLKKRPAEVQVAVAFAGETHRFAVKVPR